jgi:hypothetical protein
LKQDCRAALHNPRVAAHYAIRDTPHAASGIFPIREKITLGTGPSGCPARRLIMTPPVDWSGRDEPALDEVLSDPIVCAVMRRDGLVRSDVEKALLDGAIRRREGAARLLPISA